MADYSMDDDKWDEKKNDIAEWFDANPEHENRRVIVDGLFAIGDMQSDLRKRHWSSIAGVFADLANTPIGQGRKSLMDTATKSDFEKYLDSQATAYAEDVYPVVSSTARTHGKSGGILYSDMEGDSAALYADDCVKKERLFLNAAFNAHAQGSEDKRYFWDGSYDDGYPVVVDTAPPQEVSED